MKTLLAVMGLALSLTVHANSIDTVFKKDSKIPVDLQERILSYVQTHCSGIVSNYGLNEVETVVRADKIDQGMVDYYFSTTLSSRYYFDGTHPITTFISVESAQYAFQNGDNLAVLKVDANGDCQ